MGNTIVGQCISQVKDDELRDDKIYALIAASELYYPKECLQEIVQAKTVCEINNVLVAARHSFCN